MYMGDIYQWPTLWRGFHGLDGGGSGGWGEGAE